MAVCQQQHLCTPFWFFLLPATCGGGGGEREREREKCRERNWERNINEREREKPNFFFFRSRDNLELGLIGHQVQTTIFIF